MNKLSVVLIFYCLVLIFTHFFLWKYFLYFLKSVFDNTFF
jgi:hypothetical protein